MNLNNISLKINFLKVTNTKNIFGLVMFLNHIIYFFIFDFHSYNHNIPLVLRVIACLLCFPLIFIDFRSNDLSIYKKLYWYLVVCYCLPFFFTFRTLINNLSAIWLMNTVSAAFLMILVLNIKEFFILFLIGISTSFLIYTKGMGLIIYPFIKSEVINTSDIIATYAAVIAIGIIFAYNKETIENERFKISKKIEFLNAELEVKVKNRTAELEKALEAKKAFLNNISHELRTPLQGFGAFSEGLVEHWEKFDNTKRKSLAVQISSNAKRLVNLMNNLLDLTTYYHGRVFLHLTPIFLDEIIEELIAECKKDYLNNKNLHFYFNPHKKFQIIADKEKIYQLIKNILVNATKYSPEGGIVNIYIRHHKQGNMLHVIINDNGIGIPEDELEEIFAPFSESSRTKSKAGGVGLGLAIATEIIRAHKGKIWAENNYPQGASINFLLPINQQESI